MKKILLSLALAVPGLALFSGCSSDRGAYLPVNTMVNNMDKRRATPAADQSRAQPTGQLVRFVD